MKPNTIKPLLHPKNLILFALAFIFILFIFGAMASNHITQWRAEQFCSRYEPSATPVNASAILLDAIDSGAHSRFSHLIDLQQNKPYALDNIAQFTNTQQPIHISAIWFSITSERWVCSIIIEDDHITHAKTIFINN